MADQPHSRPIHRQMTRCATCRRWWSQLKHRIGDPGDPECCPCGGELELVDMEAHRATVPLAEGLQALAEELAASPPDDKK